MPIAEAERLATSYLRLADRLLPGRIEGFYLTGSTALGAFDADRSDIDFVAVVDGDLSARELGRLRIVHALSGGVTLAREVARGNLGLPETCNGSYLRASDLTRPVSNIEPLASHTGPRFSVGRAFDVNPVMWKVFAERGVALRGPTPDALGLVPQPELLRSWNLDNLDSYWTRWAETGLRRRRLTPRRRSIRWAVAWGALEPPRLHHTVATGEVISKEAAGKYALDTFDRSFHPVITEALAYRRGEPLVVAAGDAPTRLRRTCELVLEVVRSAHRLP
ncbi:MAG: aminoglycoside adenylyltransferase domain-containing protein [Acidimicrobiales bacterium]